MFRIGAVLLIGLPATALPAAAAPVLTAADVRVAWTSPTSCDVRATYTIEGAVPPDVEHRLYAPDGMVVAGVTVRGAPVEPTALIKRGATLAYRLPVESDGSVTYDIRYEVRRTGARAYRCPLWLPVVPTDGRSRPVRIAVDLPAGAAPAGSAMPALDWSGVRGVTTLGHLPSVVRAPYAEEGRSPTGLAAWDISRAMDATAVVVLVGASAFWFWNRRAGSRR